MKRIAKNYDSKSYELAEYFMQEESWRDDHDFRERCDSLAQAIQAAIEDWFRSKEKAPVT
jgi:hypothetical protein